MTDRDVNAAADAERLKTRLQLAILFVLLLAGLGGLAFVAAVREHWL